MDFSSFIGVSGGAVGVLTFCWKLLEEFRAFLHVELTVQEISDRGIKLRTTVENKKFFGRKIDGAFLLIGPLDEDPGKTAARVFEHNGLHLDVRSSNKMVRLITKRIKKDTTQVQDSAGRLMIPLPYYFKENVDVGDERLSYEQIIAIDHLPPGPYAAARFYIDAISMIPRLHRPRLRCRLWHPHRTVAVR